MSGFEAGRLNQRETERLMRECQEIASDWEKYMTFCQVRTPVLKRLFSQEGLN
jgi:hypothetical protein